MTYGKDEFLLFVFMGNTASERKPVAKEAIRGLNIRPVVKHTTRARKQKDTEGVDQYFLSAERFDEERLSGTFADTVRNVRGDWYGIAKSTLEEIWKSGSHAYVTTLDPYNGIKQLYGDRVIRVFIGLEEEEFRHKMTLRGYTEGEATKAVDLFKEQWAMGKECEHTFINRNTDDTVAQVRRLLTSYIPS